MKRFFLPLLLLLFLVFEGVAPEILPRDLINGKLYIIPHWVLVFSIMITIFYDLDHTFYAVLYGVIFGFIIDVVYTDVLGVYMFFYGVVNYFIHGLKLVLHSNLFIALLLVALGVTLADVGLYVTYNFIRIADVTWQDYAMSRLIPTVVANLFFLIVIYPLFKGKLEQWSELQLNKKR
ncbi:rod shape-determining protein MreD [Terrihalobacillus insolitus]|uniref:rod shape-determining protein MreD n=1 Tax=Terrihalobacillus insolitus TaxID=2950438 RepID=UPI0023422B14|nr:rod shape-determining protein MreD [Terrihalobacillus insolitus]MDC3412470.1 rod shape-determining protein MreD [Terrihalobacillus insolitus]